MNFGLGKMRPMGHDHVYKYAHAQTVDDVKTVSWDYKGDGNSDKEWNYEMQNLSSGNSFLRGIYYAEKIDKEFPSLTTIRSFYGNSPSLMYVKLSFPNVINAQSGFADYAGTNPVERKVDLRLPKTTNLRAAFYENDLPKNGLNLYCPEVIDITNIIEWGWSSGGYSALNAEFPKAEQATGFWWKGAGEFLHDVDEDGNFSFATGKPTVGKAYTTFPSLKDAENFGMNQQLYPDYAKAFLTDLPDWTGNSENHRLRLGLSIDGKYDPELQSKLYEADETYTPTINLSGGPTSHKNWKITVDWNGMSNGYAYEPPMAELDFCTITLPDGYTSLDHLTSNGKQYIKTGYIPCDTTGMYIQSYVTNLTSTWRQAAGMCGCSNRTHWWSEENFILGHKEIYWHAVKYNNNPSNYKITDCMYYARLNYKNDRFFWTETDEGAKWMKDNLPELGFTPNRDIWFFAHNCGGELATSWSLVGDVYRFQITEGEEVVRDFVPCLDAEGTPCMRDLINGVDYYNSGSGQFTYELEQEP